MGDWRFGGLAKNAFFPVTHSPHLFGSADLCPYKVLFDKSPSLKVLLCFHFEILESLSPVIEEPLMDPNKAVEQYRVHQRRFDPQLFL